MSSLVVNPNLRVKMVRENGEIRQMLVWIPVRGDSLRHYRLSATEHPGAFRSLLQCLDPDNREIEPGQELLEMGVFVAPDQISQRVRYCIPECTGPVDGQDEVSGQCPRAIPDDDWKQFLAVSHPCAKLYWTVDGDSGIVHPWQGGPPDRSPQPQPTRGRTHGEICRATDSFARHGYAALGATLPAAQIGALRNYYEELVREGWLTLGDRQSHRYWTHNDPVARLLQIRMMPVVERITGAAIKPSYTYAVRYREGAELPAHVDRAQCQYTATMLIDFGGDLSGPSPWPLILYPVNSPAPVEIRQTAGDLAVYRGPEVRHARPKLTGCHHSTSVILHYVDASSAIPLD